MAATAKAEEADGRRFVPAIRPTAAIGPRLRIIDQRPLSTMTVRSETWFDLPVQCVRTDGKVSRLVISELGGRTETIVGTRDDLDDLYSTLKRLRVNVTYTCRPVMFDPSEDVG